MLYLTCTTITSLDLAHYGVSRAEDWVSVDCGTSLDLRSCSFNTDNDFMKNIVAEKMASHPLSGSGARTTLQKW